MTRSVSILARSIRSALGCSVFLLASPSLLAQVDLEGYWGPQFRPNPEGEALRAKLPADAIFIDDAGGAELEEGDYGGLVLSDSAKAEIAAYSFDVELTQEYACTQPSVVLYMQAPFPFEIHQSDELIVMKMEYFDMFRIIHMDGRAIPADAPVSKNGYSVGHWEGDELVVETARVSSGSFMNNGFSHSENVKFTERFALSSDGKTLFSTQVSEDPEVWQGKAARFMAWGRVPGEYVYPYECDPSFGAD
jgi:hypothetical protein